MSTNEPVAVYDVRDDQWRNRSPEDHAALAEWLQGQSIDPEESLRVEIFEVETLIARVTQFARDTNGNLMVDFERNETKRDAPFDVPVSHMPPVMPLHRLSGDAQPLP